MPKHARRKPPTKREPVLIAAVASVIVWAAVKFGLPIDDQIADAIAGVFVTAAVAWVRAKVTPVAAPQIPVEAVPDLRVTGLDAAQTTALLRSKGL